MKGFVFMNLQKGYILCRILMTNEGGGTPPLSFSRGIPRNLRFRFRFFLTLLFLLITLGFSTGQAHACFWMECEVIASVQQAETEDTYRITVDKAAVTRGHMKKGENCLPHRQGKTFTAEIPGNVPSGDSIRLKYTYYNGLSREDAAINEFRWSYWPEQNDK